MDINDIIYKPDIIENLPKISVLNASQYGIEIPSYFPNKLNFCAEMTKIEDQRRAGTCVAHSGTTFFEYLHWRITGKKKEFSNAEIYNLYWDAREIEGIGKVSVDTRNKSEKSGFNTSSLPSDGGLYGMSNFKNAVFRYNDNLSNHSKGGQSKSEIIIEICKYFVSGDFKECSVSGNNRQTLLKSALLKYGSCHVCVPGHAIVLDSYLNGDFYCQNSWGSTKHYSGNSIDRIMICEKLCQM